jgi:hypothetical protein
VKALNTFLVIALSVVTFLIGKEYFPRTVEKVVVVEKEVKVPVEVKVEVPVVKEIIKEVIKEVPAKLTPDQADAVLTYALIEAASVSVASPSDTKVLPTGDGKLHPELSKIPKIWPGSDKVRVTISLDGRAVDCCDKDEIFLLVRRRLQQVGMDCEMASSDFMKSMFQSSNTIRVQVRLMDATQYSYSGVVSTSFHQVAIGMNREANPAVGPWKRFLVTPVEEDTMIRAGKTVASSYIKENIDSQLAIVCAEVARGLK